MYIKLDEGDYDKEHEIKKIIDKNFDLSPRGIREMLQLNRPIYQPTSLMAILVENETMVSFHGKRQWINLMFLNYKS